MNHLCVRIVLLCAITPSVAWAQPAVYFSPKDNLQSQLVSRIAKEQVAIKAAVYFLTDKMVVLALIQAFDRGVKVELVVDKTSLDTRYEKISLLAHHGVPVFVYDGGTEGIMHDKFFVFVNNGDKKIVWTGSYNPTRRATLFNCENALVLEDKAAVAAYEQEFGRIKKLAKPYQTKLGRSLCRKAARSRKRAHEKGSFYY